MYYKGRIAYICAFTTESCRKWKSELLKVLKVAIQTSLFHIYNMPYASSL